jgi:hypothetical protein
MEATCSSKTSVGFQRTTTWHYFPEGRNLHNHCYENLKSRSFILSVFFPLSTIVTCRAFISGMIVRIESSFLFVPCFVEVWSEWASWKGQRLTSGKNAEFVGWSAISVSFVGLLVVAAETHPAAVSGSGVTEQLEMKLSSSEHPSRHEGQSRCLQTHSDSRMKL